MPTASERLIWAQGSPEDARLVTTSLPPASSITPQELKISATICWENYMPLFRQHLYDLGTQIYCAPTVDGREVWASTMVHIALEGRCFVLSANQMSIPFAGHETWKKGLCQVSRTLLLTGKGSCP